MDEMNQTAQQVYSNDVNPAGSAYQNGQNVNNSSGVVHQNAPGMMANAEAGRESAMGETLLTGATAGEQRENNGAQPAQPGQTTGAPEQYETFAIPQGMEDFAWDDGQMNAFRDLAKGLNLPQEGAQELFNFGASMLRDAQEASQAQTMEMIKAWEQQSRSDPAVVELAKKGSRFIANTDTEDKQVKSLLNETGIGSHPAFIKWVGSLAELYGEDPFSRGAGGGASTATNDPDGARAKRWFGDKME